jgi:hypothetical protein
MQPVREPEVEPSPQTRHANHAAMRRISYYRDDLSRWVTSKISTAAIPNMDPIPSNASLWGHDRSSWDVGSSADEEAILH